jgi:hypothetical protein
MKKLFSFKWWEVVILGSILMASVAFAQFAYESITVGSEVKTLTAATYGPGVQKAWITCEENDIRYTLDGTLVPTSGGIGHLLTKNGPGRWLDKFEIKKFKAVRASYLGDGVLKVTYY